jgi:hypothetical protein
MATKSQPARACRESCVTSTTVAEPSPESSAPVARATSASVTRARVVSSFVISRQFPVSNSAAIYIISLSLRLEAGYARRLKLRMLIRRA